MSETGKLCVDGSEFEMPVIVGTEQEKALDIGSLRARTGYITLDDGYANTGACRSAITFIDGEKGILHYRGIPIEQLAGKSRFVETAYLLIWGELPTSDQLASFSRQLTENALIHEGMKYHFEGFPNTSHPMAMLSAMINALSCYYPFVLEFETDKDIDKAATLLMSKVRTLAAFSYKMSKGQPFVYPDPNRRYVGNLLHMMFTVPYKQYEVPRAFQKALDLIFMLHADHEQNCSTSTVRMVGSAGANLYSSVSAGVCALWGPLHGGANMGVIQMLEQIQEGGMDIDTCVKLAKDKESGFRLMGFGHRVYKNYDPRAKILKAAAERVFAQLNHRDPLLDIARRLEERALSDQYFIDRKLYPNVDFYSGIIMRAIGIPTNMFTVMFAIGRLPGWIAHWREQFLQGSGRIARPRQVYTGQQQRDYIDMDKRRA
ncbi:MAG: citrate synthase [Planctomycetes bacterium]|nr:citrate synthase [Planctomycetota bacterium]